jgi:hypothetical protein
LEADQKVYLSNQLSSTVRSALKKAKPWKVNDGIRQHR